MSRFQQEAANTVDAFSSETTAPPENDGPTQPSTAPMMQRVVYQTVSCRDASECVKIIQGRVQHNWQVSAIEDSRGAGFVVRFLREQPIVLGPPFGEAAPL